MVLKQKKSLKLLLTTLLILILSVAMAIPAFAQPVYNVNSEGTLTSISGFKLGEDKSVLTLPADAGIKRIASGVMTNVNVFGVKKVCIPASVKYVETGAFVCTGLREVVIDNYDGGITIEKNAFVGTGKVTITYQREKPTEPLRSVEASAKPATTAAPKTSVAPQTTAAPKNEVVVPETTVSATTKAHSRTNVKTTKADSKETTTEPTTIEVTEQKVPLASVKEQLSDIDVWGQMINQSTEEASAPTKTTSKVKTTASYAAVVLVAFSAVVLGYIKFKK